MATRPQTDDRVTVIQLQPDIITDECGEAENPSDVARRGESVASESWPQQAFIQASALEPVTLLLSTAGFITLTTPTTSVKEAMFMPCEGNIQVRSLCPRIVQLHAINNTHSIFTTQYINVENEKLEIKDHKTIGAVQPCQAQEYITVTNGSGCK